jgi:hypothetical protein
MKDTMRLEDTRFHKNWSTSLNFRRQIDIPEISGRTGRAQIPHLNGESANSKNGSKN